MNPKKLYCLIAALEKNPKHLTKRHLKKLYAILIACGHYPICPWCKKYIYNINDFTWDHITPKSAGGTDDINNLQPMHRHCNNADKNDIIYQTDYRYDIKSDLQETIYNVRVTVSKKRAETNKQTNNAKAPRHKNNVKKR